MKLGAMVVEELLLPRTDRGVLVQLSVLCVVFGGALWASRRHADLRLVVIGVGLVVVALAGLRAAH